MMPPSYRALGGGLARRHAGGRRRLAEAAPVVQGGLGVLLCWLFVVCMLLYVCVLCLLVALLSCFDLLRS